jgi:hypothetical protein
MKTINDSIMVLLRFSVLSKTASYDGTKVDQLPQ